MDRKKFISNTLSGILLMGLSPSLVSCITDNLEKDDFYNDHSNDDSKTIFLVSSQSSIKSKKLISTRAVFSNKTAKNVVVFGYIAPTDKMVKVNSAKKNLKVLNLNDKLSYVIFNEPVEMNLLRSDSNQIFRYLDVDKMDDVKNFKTFNF